MSKQQGFVVVDNAQSLVVVDKQASAIVTVCGNTSTSTSTGIGSADGFLQTINRLSEFNTPQVKSEARQNLELENIDGGTFF